jgi:hypothetical protein
MSENPNVNDIRPPQFIPAGVQGLSASTSAAVQARGTPSTLNLDDIFGDCFFTPEGEAIFLSENPQLQQQVQQQQQFQHQPSQVSFLASGEAAPSQNASRPTGGAGFAPVPQAGGIVTTGLHNPEASVTVMGNFSGDAAPPPAPFAQAPQRPHHLQYAYVQTGGTQAPGTTGSSASSGVAKRGRGGATISGGTKPESNNKADRRWEFFLTFVCCKCFIPWSEKYVRIPLFPPIKTVNLSSKLDSHVD